MKRFLTFSSFALLCFFYQDFVTAPSTVFTEATSTCGERLFAERGVIESPNYPNHYPDNANCIWYLSAPERSRLRLQFSAFELENSTTCDYDYLEVFDGQSERATLLHKLCGNVIPSPIESTENALKLIFKTDGSVELKGFKIEFEKVIDCGGDLSSEDGNVTSPHYPDKYPNFLECLWVIRVPVNYRVMLRFRSFQLEDSPACTADYVEVRDGPDLSSRVLGWYCGPGVTGGILSSGNSMTIRFKSDARINFRGFSAHYMKVSPPWEEERQSAGIRNLPGLITTGITILLFKFVFP